MQYYPLNCLSNGYFSFTLQGNVIDKLQNLFVMKNFNLNLRSHKVATVMLATAAVFFCSCDYDSMDSTLSPTGTSQSAPSLSVTPESVARMLSEIPLTIGQVREVFLGVQASSANGYDEEYTFGDMLSSPGKGVGDDPSRTRSEGLPEGSFGLTVIDHVAGKSATRSSGFLDELASSGLQIYWPYSSDWDGKTIPAITFIPAEGREENIAFHREVLPDGITVVKELKVDEAYAQEHPVWVVNWNEDAGAITPRMLEKLYPNGVSTRANSGFKTLKIKEFKAHRQYDSWFSGGSEFYIKCGSLKAFTADVVSDLKLYDPEITDLMIKVKRGQVGKALRYNAVIVPDWSEQLSECAFLIHEDDGGKMTTWKSSGSVKIKSKSYGFEVEIPYHRNDDIVWRGKLSSNYFQKYNGVSSRLGDVSATFTFD